MLHLLWRWLTPKKSGDPYVLHMKATSGIITRLRYFACEKAEDARGGSLRPQARNRLLRLRRALSDMNDAHTNRCYPLTRAMIVDIARCSKVLDPTSEGRADTAMFGITARSEARRQSLAAQRSLWLHLT